MPGPTPTRLPSPPIAFAVDPAAVTGREPGRVTVPDEVLTRLRSACAEVTTEAAACAEASRDWWPLAMGWALDGHGGQVAGLAAAVARPADAGQVAAVLRICHEARVPVTAAGGRSGVCGASVPLHGGVVLDLTAMAGIVAVDDESLVADVLPGTFGDDYETTLRRDHGLTGGHFPQSIAISTVGGWIACRGAGQLSNRYGTVADLVVGLDVVLADGTALSTGGFPRAASGPDLTQLFVGSEGTLGVVTGARLRVFPAPARTAVAAWGLPSFAAGVEACRRILRRGARPAVLRHYDGAESARNHGTDGTTNVLLVLDEGDPGLVAATVAVVEEECAAAGGERLDDALVERWLEHRNDVQALEALTRRGWVVDTMEVAAPWSALAEVHRAMTGALAAVPGARVATAHQSHAYGDGACLYVTFAAVPPEGTPRDATYEALWDAGTRAALAGGANLSHHHGVGLNRARFVREALGAAAHDLLVALKASLDPHGILNPGKLGLPDAFDPGAPGPGAVPR